MKFVLSLFLAPLVTTPVVAAYPEKPIKIMIGYAPGSSTDIVGRIIVGRAGWICLFD